jgi:hypothetical protein
LTSLLKRTARRAECWLFATPFVDFSHLSSAVYDGNTEFDGSSRKVRPVPPEAS